MSDSTHAVMQRAFELIENDALEQAQELLSPLLESDADNPALWWVYSHALRDPDIGRAALARVLELDPSYPGARELNADVLALQTRRNDILGSPPVDDGSAQAATDINIDDWEDLQPVVAEEPEPSRSRWGLLAASIVLLIFLLGVALVASGAVDLTDLLSGFLPTQEPAVIVVVEATTEVTAEAPASGVATEASPLPTVEAAETEPTALATLDTAEDDPALASTSAPSDAPSVEETALSPAETATTTEEAETEATPNEAELAILELIDTVSLASSDFSIDRAASVVRATGLGTTLILQVCAVPGPEFNERLSIVMHAVVNVAEDIPVEVEAVAVGLLNCADPDANLRIIGVQVSLILQFANEEIEARDFQRGWQPLS